MVESLKAVCAVEETHCRGSSHTCVSCDRRCMTKEMGKKPSAQGLEFCTGKIDAVFIHDVKLNWCFIKSWMRNGQEEEL